jgi:hypothetical protein
VDKIGRQLVLLGGYVISAAGVFAQVFATTPAHFFAGKLLTGIVSCLVTIMLANLHLLT